jgi:hypothetical protein
VSARKNRMVLLPSANVPFLPFILLLLLPTKTQEPDVTSQHFVGGEKKMSDGF